MSILLYRTRCLDCNVPLLGPVVVSGVCMDRNFTYNNNNRDKMLSCICCYYILTIMVALEMYVV